MPVLTVRNLAGEECWGPTEVALDYAVDQLREDIAHAIGKNAAHVRLLKDTVVLEGGCVEAFCTEDADLTLHMLGPQNYAEECTRFLESCPKVGTEEHQKWLEQSQTSLLPSLGLLQGFDDSELKATEQVTTLCLHLLDQQRMDWYGSPSESYPDQASVLAVKILRRIAERGEPSVVRVLRFWLEKIAYVDFAVSENTTSIRTVFEVAKAVPDLVRPGDMEVILVLADKIFDLMNHGINFNVGPIHLCLETVVGILTEAHPEGARRLLEGITGFGYQSLYHESSQGRACLILVCRLGRMASACEGADLKALRETAGTHGVEATADDAVEPATWETTLGRFA